MVPSYGVYGGYELCENEPASPANEEYLHSEKYEIKHRDWQRSDSLAPLLTRLNDIRRRHPAFAELRNIAFHRSDYDQILVWSKVTDEDRMLMIANLDPLAFHEDTITLDLEVLDLPAGAPVQVTDELTGASWIWYGAVQYVALDPAVQPGHVLHLTPLTAPPA
jgi:starch synthase (maltosyl-transferring)